MPAGSIVYSLVRTIFEKKKRKEKETSFFLIQKHVHVPPNTEQICKAAARALAWY